MNVGQSGVIVNTVDRELAAPTASPLPASLGAVGYAAFALLQPIPLDEVVPFQTVMTAFEAEAAQALAAQAWQSQTEQVLAPVVMDVPALEPATESGYRPDGAVNAPADQDVRPVDDTVLREVVDVTPTHAPPVPEPVVELPPPAAFLAGGYAGARTSGDSRARQVLDELSFLFNE